MPTYLYTAKDVESHVIRDSMVASDVAQLETKLKQKKLFLVSARQVKGKGESSYKFKTEELTDFNRQLASMLASGITQARALNIMMQRDMKKNVKNVYNHLYQELQQGSVLSDALEKQTGCFPEIMINMYRAGEASGAMEQVANKLAEHFMKEQKTQNKIKSAMTYPIILIVLSVVIMLGVFIFVLPNFFDMFDSVGAEIPALTKVVMSISRFLIDNLLWVLLGTVFVVVILIMIFRLPSVKLSMDRFRLHLPKIGSLLKIIYTARFARTLSSLYSSGLSMLKALEISASTIGNTYVSNQFKEVSERVRSGATLSGAIQPVDGFDKKLISTVYIGEESGRLDEMLDSIADSFDYESEEAIDKLITFIEPAMILIMGLLIGTVVLSVFLPLFSMYNALG